MVKPEVFSQLFVTLVVFLTLLSGGQPEVSKELSLVLCWVLQSVSSGWRVTHFFRKRILGRKGFLVAQAVHSLAPRIFQRSSYFLAKFCLKHLRNVKLSCLVNLQYFYHCECNCLLVRPLLGLSIWVKLNFNGIELGVWKCSLPLLPQPGAGALPGVEIKASADLSSDPTLALPHTTCFHSHILG